MNMPNSFNHTLSNLVRHMYRMVVYVGLGLITTSCLKLFDNYFLFSIIYISRIFAYTCIIGIVGLEYKIFFLSLFRSRSTIEGVGKKGLFY